jgi:hypothetical protein
VPDHGGPENRLLAEWYRDRRAEIEAEWRRREADADAERESGLAKYDAVWRGRGPSGVFYAPLGPGQLAERRERARQANDEWRRQQLRDAREEFEARRELEFAFAPPEEQEHEQVERETATTGAEIPFGLVDKAVKRHEENGVGRRTLAGEIPGLTDWWARQILGWYKERELWLDGHRRLRWGPAITPVWERGAGPGAAWASSSPTPVALRLPRI